MAITTTLLLAGCYQPRTGDCEYLCGAGNSCPSGLTCDNNICRDPAELGTSCAVANDVDAQPDAEPDGPPACAWSFTPSSFDPCAIAPASMPLQIAQDLTYDTGENTLDANGTTITTELVGGLRFMHVTRLEIAAGFTFLVTGDLPLVIIVDGDANVAGTIDTGATPDDPGPGGDRADAGTGVGAVCTTAGGRGGIGQPNAGVGGSGGGGAGFGEVGADGARAPAAPMNPGGPGGASEPFVLPGLRGGCAGGRGGLGTVGSPGGRGGHGGGALQISARGAMTITGAIQTSGGGGLGGSKAVAGAAGGGGGGGAGGLIVLEAGDGEVAANGRLCANGGGGGAGGGAGIIQVGQRGQCDAAFTPAVGGKDLTGNTGGSGGNGGTKLADTSVTPPTSGNGSNGAAAGGGGGAVGRILIGGQLEVSVDAKLSPDPEVIP